MRLDHKIRNPCHSKEIERCHPQTLSFWHEWWLFLESEMHKAVRRRVGGHLAGRSLTRIVIVRLETEKRVNYTLLRVLHVVMDSYDVFTCYSAFFLVYGFLTTHPNV